MNNQYNLVKIVDIIKHNDNFKSFVLDYNFDSVMGQFVMVWIPKINEKPISLSSNNRITVQKLGEFSTEMFNKKVGDCIHIRGPFGNGFPNAKKVILIGGGCGIAPLLHDFNFKTPFTFVVAAKNKSYLPFIEMLESKCKVLVATDDGSYGIKGFPTDLDIPIDLETQYNICGPEVMMNAVAKKLIEKGVLKKQIYVSLERYMKCAIGVCGNCSCSGYRVCSDGPIFCYDKIDDIKHFNKSHRTRTGELISK